MKQGLYLVNARLYVINVRLYLTSPIIKGTKELAKIKKGKGDKEVKESFTAYCKPLIPCIQELRKVVFSDNNGKKKKKRKILRRQFSQVHAPQTHTFAICPIMQAKCML